MWPGAAAVIDAAGASKVRWKGNTRERQGRGRGKPSVVGISAAVGVGRGREGGISSGVGSKRVYAGGSGWRAFCHAHTTHHHAV